MENSKLYNWLLDHRHPIFLTGLLLFFILPEVIEKVFIVTIPFKIILIFLVLSSIFLIQTSPRKRVLTYGLVATLLVFIFIWNNYKESDQLERAAYIFLFTYFSFITYFLFKDLMRSKKVTASVIIGAFAGYFMIGVITFFIFAFLDNTYPDTISVDLTSENGIEDAFYFSFITLTTIGYGDFAPTSPLGQKIAILVGLVGQFYLAIVMAILVGKFLSHNPED
jgi:voltage-gated potassium channel